jgi:hypothetical protein
MIREDGTVVFEGAEQQELDRIVGERLAREKSKYADYDDLKGIDEELKAFGYEGTAKERRESLKTQREETQRQQELQNSVEEVKSQIEDEGTSPKLTAYLAKLEKRLEASEARTEKLEKEKEEKVQATKQADQKKEHMATMISEFEETYPNIDLEKLNNDEDFIEFLKDSNPNLSLSKVYERYNKYTHGATEKAIAKIQSNLERSTSSGKQRNSNEGGGLSSDQRQTVDDWNKSNPQMKMTYQEFSNSLRK